MSAADRVVAMARARQVVANPGWCKAVRLRAGSSQDEIGEALGVSGVTVHRWEQAVTVPSGDTLLAYVDLLARLDDVAIHEVRPDGRFTWRETRVAS